MPISLDDVETLLALYKISYRIRHVELEIARQYTMGEMRCPVHLSIGQEMPSALLHLFFSESDYVVSTHRAHAHYIAKGGNIPAMLAEIFGKVTGCSKGRGGSMHLSDPTVNFMGSSAIVGNSIPIGVGIAYGIKIRNESTRSFVFIGDGATEEGVFYESINFAVLHNLPVTFVCENNFYSVYSRLDHRQPRNRRIYQLVQAMGMRSSYLPFGDLQYSFSQLNEILTTNNMGPSFIEIETYRWLEHCGPHNDDDLDYRDSQEREIYLNYDILEDLKARIAKVNIEAIDLLKSVEREIHFEAREAFAFARNSPFPNLMEARGDFYEFK